MKLPFKSSQALFEYCNKYFDAKIKKGLARPALVPSPGFMGIENHVTPTTDGRFKLSLLVAGPPDGFFLISETLKHGSEPILHGDLVLWLPQKAPPLIGKGMIGKLTGDKRSSWFGLVVSKIAPEINEEGCFTEICKYS